MGKAGLRDCPPLPPVGATPVQPTPPAPCRACATQGFKTQTHFASTRGPLQMLDPPPQQLSWCRSPPGRRGLARSRWEVSPEKEHFWPHVLLAAAPAHGAEPGHPARGRLRQGAAQRSAAKPSLFCPCSEETLLFLVSHGKGSSWSQLPPTCSFPTQNNCSCCSQHCRVRALSHPNPHEWDRSWGQSLSGVPSPPAPAAPPSALPAIAGKANVRLWGPQRMNASPRTEVVVFA